MDKTIVQLADGTWDTTAGVFVMAVSKKEFRAMCENADRKTHFNFLKVVELHELIECWNSQHPDRRLP